MYWIANPSDDPALNLALEEYLMSGLPAGHPGYAILWQNRPTIVVGRFQNARQEINESYVREHGITVVRRMTGGGAVYHDAGTLNYTFIHHLGQEGVLPSFRDAGKPIALALRSLGLPVEFSGRNDLILDGSKVAGVAHCRIGARFLHHGCILVDSDLDVLSQALRVDPEKFRSKGVASVRSRVTNLADWLEAHKPAARTGAPNSNGLGVSDGTTGQRLTVERVRQAILAHCGGEVLELGEADWGGVRTLRDSKYATDEWVYGMSPAFTEHRKRRFPWGKVEVFYDVKKGRIASCRILGDFFVNSAAGQGIGVEEVERALTGVACVPEAIAAALETVPLEAVFSGCDPRLMRNFLAGCET